MQRSLEEILRRAPVVPIVTLAEAAAGVPLARALAAGGLGVVEVTLRTPAALGAVRAIRAEVPEMAVGVGSILATADLSAAREAGAHFAVSPGLRASLLEAAARAQLAFAPGVQTPTEVTRALVAGFDVLKFFPAEPAGGPAVVAAMAGPFPEVTFWPTGGIDEAAAGRYLALDNVVSVGGSWVAPAEAIAAGDWAEVEARARRAMALGR